MCGGIGIFLEEGLPCGKGGGGAGLSPVLKLKLKQGCEWTDKSMNRDRESRPRLVSDGSFFGDSFSNLEIDDNVRILHNLGLDPAGNISPALAFQHDRDSRDRDRDNIRIFLKCLELLVSVETLRHVPSRC